MEIDYNKIIYSIVDCLVIDRNDIDIQANEEEKNIIFQFLLVVKIFLV